MVESIKHCIVLLQIAKVSKFYILLPYKVYDFKNCINFF